MFSGLDVAHDAPIRRWTTLVSFTLQVALVSAALVFPLLYPHSLPEAFAHRRIFVPVRGDVEAQPVRGDSRSTGTIHVQPLVVNQARFSFHPTQTQTGEVGIAQPPSIGLGVVGSGSDVANEIASEGVRVMPRPPEPARQLRISALMQGNLIHRVEPQYPIVAKEAGIQGMVVIHALISRSGVIEQANVVDGSPLLASAALAAVRQWKYRPYYLNGEPVEVETQITVNFVLNR